jgi:hypothetical protein
LLFLLLLSCGIKFQANTQPYRLTENEFADLEFRQPVSVENASEEDADLVLCRYVIHSAHGNLYEFTETAVGIVEETLGEDAIAADGDNAAKRLELAVESASCEIGTWRSAVYVTLGVTTGSGLEKQYEVDVTLHGLAALSAACQRAIGHTVKRMLNDQDIIAYLESP